jgi:hypothetical protein
MFIVCKLIPDNTNIESSRLDIIASDISELQCDRIISKNLGFTMHEINETNTIADIKLKLIEKYKKIPTTLSSKKEYKNPRGDIFIIYDSCLESLPCYHYIEINNKIEEWDGVEIYDYLIDNNYNMIDHFANYGHF